MAWKVVQNVKLNPGDTSFVVGAPMDRALRVTVEEEVSECCEKWRAIAPKDGDARWLQTDDIYRPILFCPDCGRRL